MKKPAKSRKQTEKTEVVSLRLPVGQVAQLDALSNERGVSRSRIISDIINQRGLPSVKDDRGLQLERLQVLRSLKPLLDSGALEVIERHQQLQEIFDDVYEMFFSAMKSAEDGADGGQ